MKKLILTIDGPPVPKQRPRLGKWGCYTPKKTKDYEKLVQACFREQSKDWEMMTGPVYFCLVMYMPIPKSVRGERRKRMEEEKEWHIIKPDDDNMLKAVKDALNGLAYKDDCQTCETHMYKIYSPNPRTIITISEPIFPELPF